MKPLLRILSLVACLVLNGCAWRMHEPAARTDMRSDDTWGLRCETVDPDSANAQGSASADSKERWAYDAGGNRILLEGRLEDGFFVTRHAVGGETAINSSKQAIREACHQSAGNLNTEAENQFLRVQAARHSEKINIPLVYDHENATNAKITRLIVFGDSLSDAGRLRERMKVFPGAPYWAGRFSNGPVWTDYLEASTPLAVQNHAYGGASVTDLHALPGEGLIAQIKSGGQIFVSGSIEIQVDDYIANYLSGGQLTSPDNTAFLIWAGANDYISKEPITGFISTFLNSPEGKSGYRQIADATIVGLEQEVRKLYAAGARRFVLVNLPDLGRTPIVLQNDSYTSSAGVDSEEVRKLELSERLSELTRYHNQELASATTRLANELKGAQVILADARAFIDLLYTHVPHDNGHDYGFGNGDSRYTLNNGTAQVSVPRPCYTGGYLGSNDPSDICDEPHATLFWDVVHPTTHAHCWQAYHVRQVLADAGWVPLETDERDYGRWCKTYRDGL